METVQNIQFDVVNDSDIEKEKGRIQWNLLT